MKTSIKDIILGTFSVIGMSFVLFLLIAGYFKRRSLDKNLEFSKAVIIDDFKTIKNTQYLGYKFMIKDKEYHGSGRYYPDTDTFAVGDTIVIFYDRTNPDNNTTWRDY